jgi:hypothetical protein
VLNISGGASFFKGGSKNGVHSSESRRQSNSTFVVMKPTCIKGKTEKSFIQKEFAETMSVKKKFELNSKRYL